MRQTLIGMSLHPNRAAQSMTCALNLVPDELLLARIGGVQNLEQNQNAITDGSTHVKGDQGQVLFAGNLYELNRILLCLKADCNLVDGTKARHCA